MVQGRLLVGTDGLWAGYHDSGILIDFDKVWHQVQLKRSSLGAGWN